VNQPVSCRNRVPGEVNHTADTRQRREPRLKIVVQSDCFCILQSGLRGDADLRTRRVWDDNIIYPSYGPAVSCCRLSPEFLLLLGGMSGGGQAIPAQTEAGRQ
jgi:hypothetical protein